MKKSMYLLVMLMLGLSCALWTGCSDDENGPGEEQGNGGGEGEGEGEGEGGGDVAKDTVYQVKTIKLGEVSIELAYASGKVQTIKTKRGVNVMPDATVEYSEGKAAVLSSAQGYDQKIEYTLKNGYAEKAVIYDISDPADPYEEYVYNFTLNAGNSMVETIADEEYPDEPFYKIIYKGSTTNWDSLVFFDLGSTMKCTFSELKNNYTVDLNNLLCNYSSDEVVNFAILCGLIPNTENVLASLSGQITDDGEEPEEMRRLTKAEETVLQVVATESNGQISKVELKAGDQTITFVELGF